MHLVAVEAHSNYNYGGNDAQIGLIRVEDGYAYPTVNAGFAEIDELHVTPNGSHAVVKGKDGQFKVLKINP